MLEHNEFQDALPPIMPLTDAPASPPHAAAPPALPLEQASLGSDSDVSDSFDAGLQPPQPMQHLDFSQMTTHALNSVFWGIEAGLRGSEGTLADERERDLVVGDQVFVLQLEWGDDSLGPLGNRLEGRVVRIAAADDPDHPSQACIRQGSVCQSLIVEKLHSEHLHCFLHFAN